MTARSAAGARLLAPDQALTAYLDGLLTEVPGAAASPCAAEGGDAAGPVPPVPANAPAAAAARDAPFEAVVLDVQGLRLAVPADAVARVMAFRAECLRSTLPLRPWVLGMLDAPEGALTVCNPAALVMPQPAAGTTAAPPRRLLVMRGASLALACGAIAGILTLHPTAVRWRTAAGRRTWLAGTVMAHDCALLDTEGLRALAESG